MKKAVLRGFTRTEKEEIHVFESNFHEMFAPRPGVTAKVELSVIPTSTEDYGPWQVQSTMPERDLWLTQAVIDRAQRTKTSAIILGGNSLLYDTLTRYCGENQMSCELLGTEQEVMAVAEEIEHSSHVFFVPQGRESQCIDLMECLFRHRIKELSSMNPSVQPIAICACGIDRNQLDENFFYLMVTSRLRHINFFTSFSSKDQLKRKYALYSTAPYECTGVCTTYSPCPVKKERLEFMKSDLYPGQKESDLFIEDLFKELGTKGAIKVIAFLWVLFFFVVAFESTQQQWFEGMPVVAIILLIATIAALAVTFFGTIIQWTALTERIYKKQFSRQSLLSLLKWFGAAGALVIIIKTITLVS